MNRMGLVKWDMRCSFVFWGELLDVIKIAGFTARNQQENDKFLRNALKLRKLRFRKFYVKTVFEINVRKLFLNIF